MSNVPERTLLETWVNSWGCKELSRTFGIAIHPMRLLVGLAVLVLVIGWGSILDVIWQRAGHGVPPQAIALYQVDLLAELSGELTEELTSQGVFEHWRNHQMRCMVRAARAICHGNMFGVAASDVDGFGLAPPTNLTAPIRYNQILDTGGFFPILGQMGTGVQWWITQRTWFFVLFMLVALPIMAAGGGVIVRQAVVAFARNEQPSIRESVTFVRGQYWAGFVSAPVVFLAAGLLALFLCGLIGWILAIPWLGDLLSAPLFGLALLFGFGAALCVFGGLVGGSFLWPAVAAERSDALTAMSQVLHFVSTRPLRVAIYAAMMLVYGALAWWVVRLIAMLGLWAALTGVASMAGRYTVLRDGYMSIEDIWAAPTLSVVFVGALEAQSTPEWISVFFIRIWALAILGAVWAFTWCFYLCGSTVVYLLLRREVDEVDLEEIHMEDYDEPAIPPPPVSARPGDRPLTIVSSPSNPAG